MICGWGWYLFVGDLLGLYGDHLGLFCGLGVVLVCLLVALAHLVTHFFYYFIDNFVMILMWLS